MPTDIVPTATIAQRYQRSLIQLSLPVIPSRNRMQLWKPILAYDGTPFHGWQVQPGLPTVQGTLAQAIHHITGETVLPQGSGRTDAGVHALAQVATFALAAPIPPATSSAPSTAPSRPASASSPPSHAPADFHARHSALRKTYEYRIFPRPPSRRAPTLDAQSGGSTPDRICPPFLAPYVWDCPWPLDLDAAQQAAAHILGTHDFTTFAASDPDLTTRDDPRAVPPLRLTHASTSAPSIHSAWTQHDDLLIYRVTGSGFLHHMVRNLVGTFVDAAAGRISPAAIPAHPRRPQPRRRRPHRPRPRPLPRRGRVSG